MVRVQDNWERLVKAILHRTGASSSVPGHGRHPSGIAGPVPDALGKSTTNIDAIFTQLMRYRKRIQMSPESMSSFYDFGIREGFAYHAQQQWHSWDGTVATVSSKQQDIYAD